MTDPVVVGVDGSPPSEMAAQYAADAAVRRSAPLMLVHGYLHPFRYGVPFDPYAVRLPPPSDEAVQMLDELAAELRTTHPDLTVATRQAPGGPAAALIDASQHAQLLVVGSRGHGGFSGLLLGSVSAQVTAHAHCPVLVVRPPEPPGSAAKPDAGPVVVGVDGSAASALAAAFAADEAVRRDTKLIAIHIWSLDASTPPRSTYEETEATAGAAAEALLAGAAAEAQRNHPELNIERQLVHALDPTQRLLDASRNAGLLVVGSRGRGGFSGLLLGSTSQALAHHAHCPVVIAHPHGHRG
ncbi:MAG TPA: universal stress protein [Micromonosporaceae bacterium]